MHGVVTVRVGTLAVPTVIDDLAWVAAHLDTSPASRLLAARITSGLKPGTQLELEPRSADEQDALAGALSELIWERRGGQLLRRLRDAVVSHPLDSREPLHEVGGAALDAELLQRTRAVDARRES